MIVQRTDQTHSSYLYERGADALEALANKVSQARDYVLQPHIKMRLLVGGLMVGSYLLPAYFLSSYEFLRVCVTLAGSTTATATMMNNQDVLFPSTQNKGT